MAITNSLLHDGNKHDVEINSFSAGNCNIAVTSWSGKIAKAFTWKWLVVALMCSQHISFFLSYFHLEEFQWLTKLKVLLVI
jgi:hypothetical protein